MSALLDLPSVHRFADDMNERLRQCENGESTVCASLDQSINFHIKICEELRSAVHQWARSVFAGRIAFDSEVDQLLRAEIQILLDRAKKVAANGRTVIGQCYKPQELDALNFHIADFGYLMENWVTPQLSVSPAPRVKLSEDQVKEIVERLEKLQGN